MHHDIQVELTLSSRISLICFLSTNISQLWIFTYSCDFMARESTNVANAAYTAPWTYLPMDRFGKMVRKDLQIVIMRSRRACYLTACGFFPISLETFTKVTLFIILSIFYSINKLVSFLFKNSILCCKFFNYCNNVTSSYYRLSVPQCHISLY